jgi:FkbM family methyltransferase
MNENEALRTEKLAQWLINALIATPESGRLNRGRYRILSVLRRLRLRFSDPLVRFSASNLPLVLPLSHELPLYRRALPHYALNLGRVSAIVQAKYPNLTMIDVGANIGDSVAIVRAWADIPMLCIEGEERFFQLLQANTRRLQNIELEHTFLGAADDHVRAVRVERGTAAVALGMPTDGAGATMLTLGEAVSRHPRFSKAKFLKLDAEGFDCRIITCESRLLEATKPVIFFEYHPPLCAEAGYDPFPVFSSLSDIGYVTLAIYENTGAYQLSLGLEQRSALEDIHRYLAAAGAFCDMVAFHAEDQDIAEAVRKSEFAGAVRVTNKSMRRNAEVMANVV